MASEMPRRIFRNFGCWMDKESYIGQASEIDLPELKTKTDDMVNAGMVMPIEVVMMYEKLDAKVKMPAFDEKALMLFGLKPGVLKSFMFTGAFVDEADGATTHSAVIHSWGFVKRLKVDNWKVGDKKLDNEWEISLREFSLEIDGQPIYGMGPFEVTIGGVPQTGDIRRAILA